MANLTLTLPQALNRAVSAYQAGKFIEAEKICQQIISAKHDFFDALHLLAVVQASLGENDLALASYDRALSLRPDYADALYNRGNALQELKRHDEALASYDHALAVRPDYAKAFNNRGSVLKELKQYDEALASYDHALAVRPDYAEALYNRGVTLQELKRHDEALASYDRALSVRPDYADALYNRGNALKKLERLDEALASYDRALAAKPDHAYAFGEAAGCVMKLCDWDRRTRFAADVNAHVSGKKSIISPFMLLGYSDDPALQLQCARNYIENEVALSPRPFWIGQTWRHDKLRIAYLSADFRSHAVAYLIAELIENHDRSRFEIIGASFGVDDGSGIRKRLVAAFDGFHDVRRKSDQEVAKLLYDLRVDVAIDLMGYTQDSRPGIFAYRPAPIQVNYLGYPGTMGTQFIDYIVADKVVAPFEHQPFYTEKIVHLPDCYWVTDTKRKIAERGPARREMGLPEHGFVFCCFNNNWKIAPAIFDAWMRLLHRVEGSVLWLKWDNESAERNLRMEARQRGIDPSRLVFARWIPLDEHLPRYRLADLFLDTLPYNAHTTASDALWAGLPVLTCKGKAFAGRVAASLLQALGLPELTTSNLEEYQALALKLARDPALLADIKAKLARHRDTYPLFDTDRFARHIESAYTTMWEIWQRGEAPKSFSVEPVGKMASHTPTLPQTLNRAVSAYQAGKFIEAEKICRQIISAKHDFFDALHLLAVVQASLGRNDLALASYDRALSVRPDDADALYNRGVALRNLKRHDEALASYDRALSLRPDDADALYNRGVTLHKLKRLDEALASYDRALLVRPDHAEALNNRGVTLQELKRLDEALASYDRALSLRPDDADALYNRGVTLQELKRLDEALASYDRALAVRPDYAEALYNRGNALQELQRLDEALASYDRALSVRPDHAQALNNRGNALKALKRLDEALASYDHALSVRPDYAEALNNRGNALEELKRLDEALASYDRALFLRPDDADALYNRGVTLHELKRYDQALASYDRALFVRPDYAQALYNRGNALKELERLDEALASYDRALAAKPDHAYAFGEAAGCVMKLCDWDRRTRFAADVNAHVSGKKSIISPFVLLGYSDDPTLQLQCARNYIENEVALSPRLFWTGQTWHHNKLRIAYLSADFRTHPTAYLTAELFEIHDRSRFEIIGASFGVDDRNEIRKRLVAAFDGFHDVRRKNDQEVAKLLYDLQVDIAIDLMGHTRDSRPGIFAYRPAPIQVSYLGFPATTGADFIDYILADKVVTPFEHQPFYTEKIVHLPDCYQVNDRKRKIAERAPTRREMGLPEHGLVFCCFNNNSKIAPEIFDAWMRLLHRVEGSVLWLLQPNESAERNLRMEARRRGIDPSRLVFARRLPLDEHLARHRLADLFLDTLPYNAHTTASDALWAGLPVLTCKGEAFAGRVAASLLHAVGLPELIAANLEEYQALALKLARDPALLADIKAKLARHRDTYPLFDTDRFARHIESAYTTMWEIWRRGEAPKSFSVEPVG